MPGTTKIFRLNADTVGDFVVPPECAGQIVEDAYAVGDDVLVRRTTDRSDRSVSYASCRLDEVRGPIEPWNRAPSYDEDDMVDTALV